MKITAHISGFEKAIGTMKQLADRIERGGMRESLTKAARPMTKRVKSLAPTGTTGMLKKSIRSKVVTSVRKHTVTIFIGPSRKVNMYIDRFGNGNIKAVRPANYAHLVEFGTTSRGSYGRKGVKLTSGNPPRPFIRPGYEQTKHATHAQYAKFLGVAILKAADKHRNKSRR